MVVCSSMTLAASINVIVVVERVGVELSTNTAPWLGITTVFCDGPQLAVLAV